MSNRTALMCLLALTGALRCALAGDASEFRAPPGFDVSLFADDSLAHDVFALAFDSQGRVVVSGPGYIKLLHDDDGDRRADRATLFSELPKTGAQGMYFDGHDLIFTGDGILGRLRDADANSVADGPPEPWTRLRNGEHGAHAVLLGPDGSFYVVCGNDAGVGRQQVATNLGIQQPRAGTVLRVSRDGRQSEVWADGFRNPYDLAFGAAGHLFTVDSDGERDHHLPWYAPTRLFDISPAWHHGWLENGWQRAWNQPESFFDNVARAAELGRGSPTGLIAYRHGAFPPRYRAGLFSACWTLGRVYFLPLARHGSTFTSEPEIFLETTGDVGFAPVDLAVAPDGDLYVAIGGRRTRGSVFRIHYRGASTADAPEPGKRDSLHEVLDAPEPLESWSRAHWVPAAMRVGREAFEQIVTDAAQTPSRRARALEVLTELFDGVSPDLARAVIERHDPLVSARLAWSLGSRPRGHDAAAILAELTHDGDAAVARAAWEALARVGALASELAPSPAWREAMNSPDRALRTAMLIVAHGAGRANFESQLGKTASAGATPREQLGRLRLVELSPTSTLPDRFLPTCAHAFAAATNADVRLEALRLVQLAFGDVLLERAGPDVATGYVAARVECVPESTRQEIGKQLAAHFPTGEPEVDRELARTLAMLGVVSAPLVEAVTRRWTDSSPPADDLHYLFVDARLPGKRTRDQTAATAKALVRLHAKLQARGEFPSRNWPERVVELFGQLCVLDPSLAPALVAEPDFGRAEHSIFLAVMPKELQTAAARKLLATATQRDTDAAGDDTDIWTAELITALRLLPADELFPVLRAKWDDDPALRDTIARVLARSPQPEDRARFVEALDALDDSTVERAAQALTRLAGTTSAEDYAQALRALRRACVLHTTARPSAANAAPDPAAKRFEEKRSLRAALATLLDHWSGRPIRIDESTADDLDVAYRPWFDWFRGEFPGETAALVPATALDVAAWPARLAAIDWSQADEAAGRAVFEKQSCHRCHRGQERSGNDRLGPDLTGVTARYTRDDLFAAIYDPSRTVAPLYRTTLVATRSGKVYHGLVVYESPDGTLVQTGPDTTVRITGEELRDLRASDVSLMPTGLLDGLTDRQLADLYAYLHTLSRAQ